MSPWYAAIVAPVVGLLRRVFRWDEPKVPDLRELRLEDALREVRIETAKQKAAELKAENERIARESALPPPATP